MSGSARTGGAAELDELDYLMAAIPTVHRTVASTAALAAERDRLAWALGVADDELLDEILEAGYTPETCALLFLAPFVEVAWAEGAVSERERELVLEAAWWMCVGEFSAAYAQLVEWLRHRPSDELFRRSTAIVGRVLATDALENRSGRARGLVSYCRRVAEATGPIRPEHPADDPVTPEERSVIRRVAEVLDRLIETRADAAG